MTIKTCAVCESEFEAVRSAKTCSAACSKENIAARRRSPEHRKYANDYRKTSDQREYDKLYARGRRQTPEWQAYARSYKQSTAYKEAARRYSQMLTPKLRSRLRSRINSAVRNNSKAGSAVRDLGCSIVEFKAHIAAQFLPGMSWANYGDWHLDHIFPLSKFDLTDREQFLYACHFTNYRPLWAKDNLQKHASVEAWLDNIFGKAA